MRDPPRNSTVKRDDASGVGMLVMRHFQHVELVLTRE